MNNKHFKDTIKLNILGMTLILFVGSNPLNAKRIDENNFSIFDKSTIEQKQEIVLSTQIQNTKWNMDGYELEFLSLKNGEGKISLKNEKVSLIGTYKVLFEKSILMEINEHQFNSFNTLISEIQIGEKNLYCVINKEKKTLNKII